MDGEINQVKVVGEKNKQQVIIMQRLRVDGENN